MGDTFEGELTGSGLRLAVVVSRFNESVTTRLLAGAREACAQHGIGEERMDVAWVPGCFELPLAAKKLAESHRYDAIVCVDVLLSATTIVTALVQGRRVSLATDANEVAVRVAAHPADSAPLVVTDDLASGPPFARFSGPATVGSTRSNRRRSDQRWCTRAIAPRCTSCSVSASGPRSIWPIGSDLIRCPPSPRWRSARVK